MAEKKIKVRNLVAKKKEYEIVQLRLYNYKIVQLLFQTPRNKPELNCS